jgi:hypothetical protein
LEGKPTQRQEIDDINKELPPFQVFIEGVEPKHDAEDELQ